MRSRTEVIAAAVFVGAMFCIQPVSAQSQGTSKLSISDLGPTVDALIAADAKAALLASGSAQAGSAPQRLSVEQAARRPAVAATVEVEAIHGQGNDLVAVVNLNGTKMRVKPGDSLLGQRIASISDGCLRTEPMPASPSKKRNAQVRATRWCFVDVDAASLVRPMAQQAGGPLPVLLPAGTPLPVIQPGAEVRQ